MAKKEYIKELFNDIAPAYDNLNHLLSMNIDRRWRKYAVKKLDKLKVNRLLDVACGTGDLSIEAVKYGIPVVEGVDIADNMLEIGRKKVEALGFSDMINLKHGDCENLEFTNNSFDAVMIGFGIRNVEDPQKGLNEMYRIVKPGGTIVVLEFSTPGCFPVKQMYMGYFKYLLPFIGKIFSGHKQAYHYLPMSVTAFPQGESFLQLMQNAGFINLKYHTLTFGIATVYWGKKS